jgi:hypothetical protein
VLGDVGLARADELTQLTDTLLTMVQRADDQQAFRIAQRLAEAGVQRVQLVAWDAFG